MRLKSIKLAGFKSFVDPTTFELPGQLIGVVGPNGCGKSNIIDAVRWVLGESRASELRGESMQDVIFNGSGLRKPAGRASVELIFDNTDGKAQGQWANFGEISVKRVLTRDGASNYLINQQVVRRKDIQDMFLGTGLGPRAYAIIGQGTISRIIESKPEELRVFLEEAAGVSKYKERRKETEARLEDTQENMTRVRDILRELDAQLQKLESQAEIAEKFTEYQHNMLEMQQMLWVMRMTEGEQTQTQQLSIIRQAQVELEEKIAQIRSIETELETKRTFQYDLQNNVSEAQGDLYEVNAQISRLESEIKFASESKQRLENQLQSLETQLLRWQAQHDHASEQHNKVMNEIEQAQNQDEICQSLVKAHEAQLPELDERWIVSDEQVNQFRNTFNEYEKQLVSKSALIQGNDSQIEQSQQRIVRLEIDFEKLIKPNEQALITALDRSQSALKKRDEAQIKFQQSEQAVPVADKARQESQHILQNANQAINQTQAKLSALKGIQERVQSQGKLRPWLEKNRLHELPRLWQKIQVENGWESAVESILRERTGAIQTNNLNESIQFVEQIPPGRVAWFESTTEQVTNKSSHVGSLTPLLSRILVKDLSLSNALQEWLANVFVIDSVSDALAKRKELPIGGVFVAKSGHIISRVGIQLYAEDSEQSGLIARAKEIESLDLQIKSEQLILEEAQSEHARMQAQYLVAHQQSIADRQAAEQTVKDAHRFEMETLQLKQAEQEYASKAQQVQNDITETQQLLQSLNQSLLQNRADFNALEQQILESRASLDQSQSAHQELQKSREEALRHHQELASKAQESAYELRTLLQRQADLQNEMKMSTEQIEQIKASEQTIHQDLQQYASTTVAEQLQEQLVLRSEKESALAQARTIFDELMFEIKNTDESRMGIEKFVEPIREKITAAQLKEQASRLTVEQFSTLLSEKNADIELLKSKITDEHRASQLQTQVNQLQSQIQALGPVNMAALDELKTSRERKGFLDAQSADLNEAMMTLTDAIARIDIETRSLLQDTFDQVNHHFSQIFPALFGGGTAKLMMTGEEILDSGVQVMAQPPGKKNTTIHLLSGGEKALTAISLVFALFQLNPAPFCLLDEVDAPLDDANTGRYADIVAKMSQKTQFLFISHNKITMEIANQLIGVTMQEQGVSRVVAVDLQAATALTQSR
ncbi:MAG: chromosome segregation protein SMC [Betaproteobacteria bacterium]